MTKHQTAAANEVKTILRQVKGYLHVNQDQPQQRVLFDILIAVNRASALLNKAWKISEKSKLNDPAVRKEFVTMFTYFGKIRQDIRKESKHKH